jgi:hypothetical protein
MRIRSSLFIGLVLSLAACTVKTASEPSESETSDPGASESSSQEAKPGSGEAPSATGEAPTDGDGTDPSAAADADAGATDAGVDAAPKPKIPPPTMGYLHAYTNTSETCEFSIDGVYKSTGKVLDANLYADAYVIGCKRGNGTVAMKEAIITAGQTTDLVFNFQTIPKPIFDAGTPAMGTIIGVAVGGSCTFSVNAVVVGSGATFSKDYPAGTYSVACKPVSGATKSRSVTVAAGSDSMAMFKL